MDKDRDEVAEEEAAALALADTAYARTAAREKSTKPALHATTRFAPSAAITWRGKRNSSRVEQ